MFSYLQGIVTYKTFDKIVIENKSGIGYEFEIINLNKIIFNVGDIVKVYISKISNEFEDLYYAFFDQETRDIFNDLVRIKTVGPKTAILIIGEFGIENFKNIIESNDIDKLLELKGIGSFTAKLIITELNKLYFNNKLNAKQEKVFSALLKLGFKSKEISTSLKTIDNKLNLEEMIKLTLQGIISDESKRI